MALEIIILAAGKGSRMHSALPKVLHPLAGEPMLAHVLRAAQALEPLAIHVVVGHGAEAVKAAFPDAAAAGINWALQSEQKGTGHAVLQALPAVQATSAALIMNGDVPLIEPASLAPLAAVSDGIHLLTAKPENPFGLGRIVRDGAGRVSGIVEQKDATPEQLEIGEINSGLMAMPAALLQDWLSRVSDDNAQGEYYLTDIIALAVADGKAVTTMLADDAGSVLGVNSRAELAVLERMKQARNAQALMAAGVSVADPARLDLRGVVSVGADSFIDINAVIENSEIGENVQIGANVVIRNSQIAKGVCIEPHSVIDGARVGEASNIGPFARLRPETVLAANTRIGNFVETKKATLGEGSKINHLSYVGDASVGKDVNIGAGVITCNYDGANKHQTVIGDGAFIGSDSQLVAPVEVGAGATIGAGSTISKNAAADKLTLSRAPQRAIDGWQRPSKAAKAPK